MEIRKNKFYDANPATIGSYFPKKLKPLDVELILVLPKLPIDVKELIIRFLLCKCLSCDKWERPNIMWRADYLTHYTIGLNSDYLNVLCEGCNIIADQIECSVVKTLKHLKLLNQGFYYNENPRFEKLLNQSVPELLKNGLITKIKTDEYATRYSNCFNSKMVKRDGIYYFHVVFTKARTQPKKLK